MGQRLSSFLVDTLYGTFITFFYAYAVMTFVRFNPMSLGFHPPTNSTTLSVMLLAIVSCMVLVKGSALLMEYCQEEDPANEPVGYVPAHRH